MYSKTVAFALLGLGWLVSGYLLLRLLRLAGGNDFCAAVFGRGCDEALLSPTSWQLGFPLAGWGLVYFALVGLLLALGSAAADRATLLVTAAGVGASLVMTSWLLRGSTPLCPLCLVVHAANLGLFVALGLLVFGKGAPLPRRRWTILVAAALAMGGLFQAVLAAPGLHGGGRINPAEVIAAFEQAPVEEIAEHPGGTEVGASGTDARLVVFSSFQCPACRQFAVAARHLEEHFGDDLAIVYKHFPLETECNPHLAGDMQPRSCEAAMAAEAARLQGAFWPFHDRLFDSDLSATEEVLAGIATSLHLDLDRWQADRASVAALSRVYADAQLGAHLGVQGTPTVFLNGRRLGNPPLPVLEVLIGHQLKVEIAH